MVNLNSRVTELQADTARSSSEQLCIANNGQVGNIVLGKTVNKLIGVRKRVRLPMTLRNYCMSPKHPIC